MRTATSMTREATSDAREERMQGRGKQISTLRIVAPYDVTELLNIVAHELRAPITPLKMRLQQTRRRLQREGERERDVVEISTALYYIERIQQKIAIYLEATAMMGNTFTLITGMGDLTDAARRLAAIYGAAQPGRTVRVEEPGAPLTGVWDILRIDIVLRELLGNAVRYGSGDVTVRLSRNRRFARVEVEDAGTSIPPSLRRRIFEPYVTGDQHNHGLGLGLYVAREIVLGHGGQMGLRVTPGGSTFWFTLPLSE